MTLNEIGVKSLTDKCWDEKKKFGHGYLDIYERYLEPMKHLSFTMLELGVGGYQYPDRGGESLRMWHEYFTQAKIVGVDCYDKDKLPNMPADRITILKGGQTDPDFLARIIHDHGQPKLIIDDASHQCDLTIQSFEFLFPLLAPGGLYFCEDVHTSFWLDYKGDPDPKADGTTLKFFQQLTPQLSQDSLQREYHTPLTGYLDFIHFYRNLVIIKKK